jgi:hypothetical protein
MRGGTTMKTMVALACLLALGACADIPGEGPWQGIKVGESADAVVSARDHWNATNLLVERGVPYKVRMMVVGGTEWRDWNTSADPNIGWDGGPAFLRRFPAANWFTVIGTVGRSSAHGQQLVDGGTFTPDADGRLYAYANDACMTYFNNHGQLYLKLTREK